MTSHDLAPDGLPYVVPGMIWDGVTEYHEGTPDGVSSIYILRMYEDGSRRFSDFFNSGNRPMYWLHRKTEEGWDKIGVSFVGPTYVSDTDRSFGYLAYDGTYSVDPVNQLAYTVPFRAHAARFAHELDAAMGHHKLKSADERDSLITHQTISAMIGSAARRYQEWDAIDPEELIVGGNFDGTPLWQHHERTTQNYIDIDEALCGQCRISTFARQFLSKADLAAFREVWRQGTVYSADRSTTPWSTAAFELATTAVPAFHDELDHHFDLMLDHYDEVVGVQDREHA